MRRALFRSAACSLALTLAILDAALASPPPRQKAPSNAGSALTGEVSDLQGLVSDLHGKVTERQIIIELPADVLFDFDKADIRPDAVPTLEKLARLIGPSHGVVQINGHTDAVGSDAYNLDLSRRRAAAVAAWLSSSGGIPAGRLRPAGFGESRPVAPNTHRDGSDNPAGRQLNRRVEVIIPRE